MTNIRISNKIENIRNTNNCEVCGLAFLDWLQYTIKERYSENERYECIQSFITSLPPSVFEYVKQEVYANELSTIHMMCVDIKPVNGYRSAFEVAGIKVYYNPAEKREEMGYNVVISGTILRECDLTAVQVREWIAFTLCDYKYQFSRIDVAIDSEIDFSYWLDKYHKREFLSKARVFSTVLDENNRGTIYIGKRSARCMVRIYDKKNEQACRLKGYDKAKFMSQIGDKSWTRFELQIRHNTACYAAINALINDKINEYFVGYLKFVNTFDGLTNKSRAEIDDLYKDVMNCEKGRTFMKITSTEVNYYHLEQIVYPQVKAVAIKYPALHVRLMESSDPSKTLVAKFDHDELAAKREERRLQVEKLRKMQADYIPDQIRIPGL